LFGGMPATGAIARTTANVKSGAKTPIAGMVHAITLFVVLLAAAPLASAIPLASLAAILILVAWNLSEIHHFRAIIKAPPSDAAVLLTTFGLTVFIDLTIAVGVGMVLASFLFMKRMAEVSGVTAITAALNEGTDDELALRDQPEIPAGVEAFELSGPFFFGVADRLKDTIYRMGYAPKVFILRMRRVPVVDATGLHALEEIHHRCVRQGTTMLLTGVQPSLRKLLDRSGFVALLGSENLCDDIHQALARAKRLYGV
jgi:SulP family sulfate permease